MSPVSIRVTSLESRRRLEPLAFRYGWPIVVGAAPIERGFVMEFEQDRLQLRDLEQPKLKPVSVDFLSGPMRHRRHHGLSKTQVFAKAIGVTPRVSRTVVDATAGLGVDAFMMACLDCRVTSIERSPAVYELLVDGFRRAVEDPELGGWLPEYLRFVHADAEAYLASLSHEERPDVVYLDPMYPHVDGKSALPKKEMQIFRKLLGPDTDSARVLERALHAATDRVVVKRPNEAPALLEGVTHAFVGKTARYDMYAVVRQSRISE